MQAECSICVSSLDEAGDTSEAKCSTLCGHIFHEECLSKWIIRSKTCPHCRSFVDQKETVRLFFNLNEKKLILTRSSEILPLQNFKELRKAADKDKELRTAIKVAIETLTLLQNTISPIRESEFCAEFSRKNSKIIKNHIRRENNIENIKTQTKLISELRTTEKKVKEALTNIDIFREKMFIVSRSLIEIMDHFNLSYSEDVEANKKGFRKH